MNITRIESRPVVISRDGRPPRFDFFVDFRGRVDDPNVGALMRQLKGMTDRLLVLDEKEVSGVPFSR